MTKEQICSLVRDELADNGVTYYSTADLYDSYDDGYLEVALYTNVIERMATLVLADATVYYNLYDNIPGFLRVFAIWNPDIQDWMSHKDIKFFQRTRYDWEKAKGNSYRFSVIDFQYIALFPHKDLAGDTELEIYHNAAPQVPLDPSTTPEMPEQFQIVLQFYMMADLFAQSEEFVKSGLYQQRYVAKMEELKHYVNNRSQPDRIHILREQFSGGTFYGE